MFDRVSNHTLVDIIKQQNRELIFLAGVEHQEYEGRLDTREGWEHLMYRLEVEEKAFVDNAGLGFASFATMDSAVDTKSEAGRDVESDVESGAHDGINASSEAPAGAAKGWFRRLLGSSA